MGTPGTARSWSSWKTAKEKARRQMWFMSKLGDLDTLHELIEEGQDVNQADDEMSRTPLHHAAIRGRCEVIDLLVKQGANVDARDAYERTPLFDAVLHEQIEAVKRLISHGAVVDVTDVNGHSPLDAAIRLNNDLGIRTLLAGGGNVNEIDTRGFSPLKKATVFKKEEAMKSLLSCGADIPETRITLRRRKTPADETLFTWELQTLYKELTDPTECCQTFSDRNIIVPGKTPCPFVMKNTTLGVKGFISAPKMPFRIYGLRQLHTNSFHKFPLKSTDEIISDVFSVMAVVPNGRAVVEVEIPLFKEIHHGRDPFLVYDQKVLPVKGKGAGFYLRNEVLCCLLPFHLDNEHIKTFMLITRPRVEVHAVGLEGGTVRSRIDPSFTLTVPPQTLAESFRICLTIHEPKGVVEESSDEKEQQILLSKVYEINIPGEAQPNGIQMQIPLTNARMYDDIVIIAIDANHLGDIKALQLVATNPPRQGNNLVADMPRCPLVVVTRTRFLRKNPHKVLENLQNTKEVVFLVMKKLLPDDMCFVTVECTQSKLAYRSREMWLQRGYHEQKTDKRAKFRAAIFQKFKVVFSDLEAEEITQHGAITFYPGALCYNRYRIHISNGKKTGRIAITNVVPEDSNTLSLPVNTSFPLDLVETKIPAPNNAADMFSLNGGGSQSRRTSWASQPLQLPPSSSRATLPALRESQIMTSTPLGSRATLRTFRGSRRIRNAASGSTITLITPARQSIKSSLDDANFKRLDSVLTREEAMDLGRLLLLRESKIQSISQRYKKHFCYQLLTFWYNLSDYDDEENERCLNDALTDIDREELIDFI